MHKHDLVPGDAFEADPPVTVYTGAPPIEPYEITRFAVVCHDRDGTWVYDGIWRKGRAAIYLSNELIATIRAKPTPLDVRSIREEFNNAIDWALSSAEAAFDAAPVAQRQCAAAQAFLAALAELLPQLGGRGIIDPDTASSLSALAAGERPADPE